MGKKFESVEAKCNNLKNLAGSSKNSAGGMKAQDIETMNKNNKDLTNAVNALKLEFARLRDESGLKFNQLFDEMGNKVNRDEFEQAIRELHDRIDGLERALSKTKADLKRAIRILDEKIKRMSS